MSTTSSAPSSSASLSTIKDSVQQQFNNAAAAYTTSPIHASGPDLPEMVKAAKLTGQEQLLDAGCGTGHTALYFAPHVAQVVALDLSVSMLAQGSKLAEERGITNIDLRQGDAEHLPFPEASFDVVTTRYSAHHWPNLPAALREFRRVLRPGGRLLVGDIVSWSDYTLDTHFQAIELLRDPSHVRDHTIEQWLALLDQAGFETDIPHTWEVQIDFASWIKRINTPAPQAEMIRTILNNAPLEVQKVFKVQPDSSFTMQAALLRGLPRN
jgi:ubiquinone/menaquinone biosynthesis C-methylase UbiE